jgi:unsaturated chondroitin disaccharide hydrolase
MLEMCRYLPDDAEQKPIFQSAAAQMLESVIDNYSGNLEDEFDGLVHHVTASKPHDMGVDGSAVYGDYFYLEALARYLLPEEEHYW